MIRLRSLFRVVAAGLFIGSCDGTSLLVDPAEAPLAISLSYQMSPLAMQVAGGAASAFDEADAIRVRLLRGDSALVDSLIAFSPAPETRVSIVVPAEAASGPILVELQILAGEDVLFFGATETTLATGEANPVSITLDPTPHHIEIDRLGSRLGLGDTLQLVGSAAFATGHAVPDAPLTWEVDSLGVEFVELVGTDRLVGLAEGTALVRGRFGPMLDSLTVTIRSEVDSVAITAPREIGTGATGQVVIAILDKRANELSRPVSWRSTEPDVIAVDSLGVLSALGEGSAWIVGTVEEFSDSVQVAVRSAVDRIQVAAPEAVETGTTAAATALVLDELGNTLNRPVAWSVSDVEVAEVDSAGVITGLSEGSTLLIASAEGVSDTVTVRVFAVVGSVVVDGPEEMTTGERAAASARVLDRAGNVIDRTVSWRSTNAAVVAVEAEGQLNALAPGSADIIASVEGAADSLRVTVASRVAFLVVAAPEQMDVDSVAQATFTAYDSNERPIEGLQASWRSSAPEVAAIDSVRGVIRGLSEGTAWIRASVEGEVDSAQVRVRSCPAAPPPIVNTPFPVSGSVARASGRLVDVTLNPILVAQGDTLRKDNFAVYEDDCVRPFEITTSEGSVGVDIAFIMDLSGSMGVAVDSVRSGVRAFAASLEARGMDVLIGSVGYSAEGDIPSTPAGPTNNEYLGPVRDFVTPSQFRDHVDSEWVVGFGGDAPENGLEAIEWAHHNLSWRPGATRVMILITDISLHWGDPATGRGSTCNGTEENPDPRCSDQTIASIVALVGANTVIHAVAPQDQESRTAEGGVDPWLLAQGTGGLQLVLAADGGVNLNSIGISQATQQTVRLTFTSASELDLPHDLRVRVTLPTGLPSEMYLKGVRYDPLEPVLRATRLRTMQIVPQP